MLFTSPRLSTSPPWAPEPQQPPAPKPAPKPAPHAPDPAPTTPPRPTPAERRAQAAAKAAPKTGRSKSLFDSFRSLPPNTRILVGLAFGAVGFAGLFWDRQVGPRSEAERAAAEREMPVIGVRVVEREKK